MVTIAVANNCIQLLLLLVRFNPELWHITSLTNNISDIWGDLQPEQSKAEEAVLALLAVFPLPFPLSEQKLLYTQLINSMLLVKQLTR